MLEGGEAPVRLKLIDDVADTDRPKEHGLAFGAADKLGWRAAGPQDVVCHCKLSFSGFIAPTAARFLLYAYDTDAPSLSARSIVQRAKMFRAVFPPAQDPIGLVAPGHEAAVDVENRAGARSRLSGTCSITAPPVAERTGVIGVLAPLRAEQTPVHQATESPCHSSRRDAGEASKRAECRG